MDTSIVPIPELLSPASHGPVELLVAGSQTAPDRHPALVYLARLAPGSRRTMRQALDSIADLLNSGRSDAETLDWASLRYQHTAAVRAILAERHAPATANKMLSALRGVLQKRGNSATWMRKLTTEPEICPRSGARACSAAGH